MAALRQQLNGGDSTDAIAFKKRSPTGFSENRKSAEESKRGLSFAAD
jgi:hypothetical protein